ncbi:MAG TPA: hypothetical protein VFG83_08055 [Kofleriaceae bacterium]|nr:hypothetical protein [Kofleriaceae bacterium]
MKLVETDIPRAGDGDSGARPLPPRPERRRVAVSLILTLAVLVTTVILVYVIFPERHDALMTAAIAAHQDAASLDIRDPDPEQIEAWTKAALGGGVPWPAPGQTLRIAGLRSLTILGRPAALVRYEAGDQPLSLLVQRARDATPRTRRRRSDELFAVSWRKGAFRFVAVGPAKSYRTWKRSVGAP